MNAETLLVKLKFRAPVHLGEVGIGVEETSTYACSDTLFSGLCHAWKLAYGEPALVELLDQFKSIKDEEPPFLISSAFPYLCEGEKKYFFFPVPLPLLHQWRRFFANEPLERE